MKKYERVALVTFSMIFMTLYAVNIIVPEKKALQSFDKQKSIINQTYKNPIKLSK